MIALTLLGWYLSYDRGDVIGGWDLTTIKLGTNGRKIIKKKNK